MNHIQGRKVVIILFIILCFIFPNSDIYADSQTHSITYYAIGDRSNDVKVMKQNLIKAGFASWDNPTTYFGPSTERAVKKFQSYYSLSTDGMMGPESLEKLNNIINSPFQRGKRSVEIQDLKMSLLIIGEASWSNPTTYYGPETERVVRSFQRDNGLVVNGIIDGKTYDKIRSLEKTKPMKKGQRNSAVLNFKNQLIKLGFASWDNPTTYFGPSTERAVKNFQSYFGLIDDGLMDYNSRSILKAAANTPYQKGKSGKDIQKVKNDLVFLGYASWSNPTSYFGPDTVRVVKGFQEQNNLIVNGLIELHCKMKCNS